MRLLLTLMFIQIGCSQRERPKPKEKTLEEKCKATWSCMNACSDDSWASCYMDCARRNDVSTSVASPSWECQNFK